MEASTVMKRLSEAIRDGEVGRYQEATTALYGLRDSVDPAGWLAIAIGIEQADVFLSRGLYKLAYATAYECTQIVLSPKFPPAQAQHHRLLVSSSKGICFLAAMQTDKIPWPALEGWKHCLDALLCLDKERMDQMCYRPYILLELSLYGIAATHRSLKSREHPGMVSIVSRRHLDTLDWMLAHELSFPAIQLVRLFCSLCDDPQFKISRWQTLLERVYIWAPRTALSQIYAEIAEVLAESTLEDRQIFASKYCVLALVHSGEDAKASLRLRCRSIAVEVTLAQDSIVGFSKTRHSFSAQLYNCNEYIRLGHYISAQRGLLKGAHSAAMASQHEYFWVFSTQLDDLDAELGGTRLRVVGRLHQTLLTLAQGGQVSKVLESLSGLYAKVLKLSIPFISGMHAGACAFAYKELGRPTLARFWARECWAWWRRCSEDQTTEGAKIYYPMLLQYLICDHEEDSISARENSRLRERILDLSVKDAVAGRWENCVEYGCLLAELRACLNNDIPDALQFLDTALDAIPASAPAEKVLRFKAKILQLKIRFTLSNPRSSREDKLRTILDLQQLVTSSGPRISLQEVYLLLHVSSVLLDNHAILREMEEDLTDLRAAATLSSSALSLLQSSERLTICTHCAFVFARSSYLIWKISQAPEDAVSASAAVENAEQWFERLRRERSSMSGVMAILAKQALARDERLESLSAMSFHLATVGGRGLTPWLCIVNSKAKSISDLLRIGFKIPQTLLSEIQFLYPESFARLQSHYSLMEQITGEVRPEKRLLLRARSENIVRQLEGDLQLGNIQAAITLRKFIDEDMWNAMKLLIKLDEEAGPKLNLVDWFLHNGRLTMCVLSGQRPTKFWTLDISQAEVQDWVDTYLETDYGLEECLDSDPADPGGPFRQLDALVAPLAEYVKEDDLLVILPCRTLHPIPLHALHVKPPGSSQAVPLVERYRVVYSASASIFVQCLQRSLAGLPWSDYFDPDISYVRSVSAFVGTYQDEVYDPDGAEEDAISEHMINLATNESDSVCLVGSDASVAAFKEHCTAAKFIHFHGHCNFEASNVLDQALIFSNDGNDEVNGPEVLRPNLAPVETGVTALEIEAFRVANPGSGADLMDLPIRAYTSEQGGLSQPHVSTDNNGGGDDREINSDNESDASNTEESRSVEASMADDQDDPDPERFYQFRNEEWFSRMELDQLAMKFATSTSEAEAIASELVLGSSTLPNELPVRQAFDLNLNAQFGPIVMLIACQSASQRVGPGDEPVGLETGLLCAGASTVVGTMWKVVSEHARTFSSYFHEQFNQQKLENELDEIEGLASAGDQESKMNLTMSFIDLAEVYRKTVRHLRESNETRNFRYWAPFVLTGSPYALWAAKAN